MANIKSRLNVERPGWQAQQFSEVAALDLETDGGSEFEGVDPVVDTGCGSGADGVLSHFFMSILVNSWRASFIESDDDKYSWPETRWVVPALSCVSWPIRAEKQLSFSYK